ncbi:sulfurtransferase complex subunit TusC [Pseudomonas matsuisoli]|nr:sulfurtransferase complex subunit TusC [Pseudomonas matsuisoli]
MMKSMLIISRQSPWSGPTAREALDIALAGGAFDIPMAILFMDDGVFQLCAGQHAATLQQKDLTANLQALSLFGIDDLYVAQSSLAARAVQPVETLSVKRVSDSEIATLINRYDHTITL